MKQISNRFTKSAAGAVAAAALFATLALVSGPVLAAGDSGESRVEARIKDMHAKLNIIQAQEEQWGKVAQVMRDNASSMEALIKVRKEHAKTMTAVDDLKSFGDITEAHADGIKKLTPVFATLYAGMSDGQKKEADYLFSHGSHKKSKGK
jgi:periplasmic protein CpxP/Spy